MKRNYKHICPSLSTLTVHHHLVMNGIKDGKSYQKMAANIFMSKSWIKMLVEDLVSLELVVRLPVKRGQGKSVQLTPLGERMKHELTNSTTLSTSAPNRNVS